MSTISHGLYNKFVLDCDFSKLQLNNGKIYTNGMPSRTSYVSKFDIWKNSRLLEINWGILQ